MAASSKEIKALSPKRITPNIIIVALIDPRMDCCIQPGRVFPMKSSQPIVHAKGNAITESNS